MICKREFRILLKGVAPQCSGMSYIVFYLFYGLFKLLVFYFQQVLIHRKVFFAFLFWFSFFAPQCSGIFIFYFFYSLFKASPVLHLTGQVLKIPIWFAENFPFFFFGFAQEMKYFVWTWFSTTISFSNLSMWIKSFFCKLQLAAI